MIADEMDRCRRIGKEINVVFDDMCGEELMMAVGCPTIPAFQDMLRNMFTGIIKGALMHLSLSQIDPGTVPTQQIHDHYNKMQHIMMTLATDLKEAQYA